MEIPKYIQDQLEEYGCNDATLLTVEGKKYWSLQLIDEDGYPAPIGLPIIFQQHDNDTFSQLSDDDALNLNSKL